MRLLRTLFAATLAALALAAVPATPAQAGDTPGSYSNFSFDGVTGLSDVAYTITVQQDPGAQSQVYWSNQVSFTNGRGGYAGMQTNAGPDRLFLFSVWDTTEYRVGSAGSFCQRFGGEGEGISCRMWHTWTAGHSYRFHYRAEGSGWIGLTVTDTTSGTSFKLGSILVGADRLSPGSVSWVEYYRWSDSRSSCASEPYSRARFEAPTGNDGTLRARITSTSESTCQDMVTVTNGGDHSVHTNGIGNSVMGPLTGIAGKCADVDGAAVILHTCHGGADQAWVLAYDGTIRSKLFTCLDASTGQAASATCTGAAGQKWTVRNGTLVNGGKCLDVEGGGSADGTRLILYTCHGGANQQWATPARPTS